MNSIFKIAILFLGLTLIQCSSDDEVAAGELIVNGDAFKLDNHALVSGSGITTGFVLNEKGGQGRSINIFTMHPDGNLNGNYDLRSNLIESGIANVTLYDSESNQIAGGAIEQPTGTITITRLDQDTFTIAFNDVMLDPGTASETTISGSATKTFEWIGSN
jgi:hypothetical protein